MNSKNSALKSVNLNFFNFDKDKIKLSDKEKISFLDQFSVLVNAGIPITNSLTIMIYNTKSKKLKFLLGAILDDVNKGKSLSQSFSRFKNTFKLFDISILEMGELTGNIGDAINEIKNKEETAKETKGKILGALIYPIIILFLVFVMLIIFMVYVIPKLTDIYKESNVNLPKLTEAVIKISDFTRENILFILLGVFGVVVFIIFFKNFKLTKYYFDKWILKIPVFGNLIKKNILNNFAFTLGTLQENGVVINKSLEICSGVVNNDCYEREIKKIIRGVSSGENLSRMLGIDEIRSGKENKLFPIELASIVKIGEQTGRLPELLLNISVKFKKEIDSIVKNMSKLIEPFVIVVMGVIVGVLILSVMLPFFNMVNVIK